MFRKKVSAKLDDAADTVFAAALKKGPKTAAVANTACRLVLGRHYVRREDLECDRPGHQPD